MTDGLIPDVSPFYRVWRYKGPREGETGAPASFQLQPDARGATRRQECTEPTGTAQPDVSANKSAPLRFRMSRIRLWHTRGKKRLMEADSGLIVYSRFE